MTLRRSTDAVDGGGRQGDNRGMDADAEARRRAAVEHLREHRVKPEVIAVGRRHRLIILATALGAVGILSVAAALALPAVLRPAPATTPAPVASATPHETGGPTTPLAEQHLVQVGENLIANPPADEYALLRIAVPDRPVEATFLGTFGDMQAVGVLTDTGRVCMEWFDLALGEGRTVCTDYDAFLENGLVVDRGAAEVRWGADGTVEWVGF